MEIMEIYVGLTLMLVVSTHADGKGPIVKTRLGSIEGYWQVSRGGRPFQAYAGIPFALPPVGELRFEPPQPVAAWEGTLPVKYAPSSCLQYKQGPTDVKPSVTGAEDCLYLNVFTPVEEIFDRNDTKLLPVIIFIYGGAYQMGEGFSALPHYFMDKDIVYVTMNHRLGPLGFLSTEDGVVPGNMGLKDQNLVMKWVSENIESFGGDPKKVTLTGLSSGASSVHLHYLSPMSRGLFHRGISGSGTALNCWTQTEESLEKAKKLAVLMGCPASGSEELVRCLKTRPGKAMFEFEAAFQGWLYNPTVPFGPVVERDSATPFIDKSPIEIISSGEVADLPWIASSSTQEGIYPAGEFIFDEDVANEVNDNWELIAPFLLDYNFTIPISEHASVARYIRSFYLGDKRIELRNVDDIIRMVGDRLHSVDYGNAVKKQARVNNSPIWFYYFGYRGEYGMGQEYCDCDQNYGVAHADEGFYLLALPDMALHNETDIQMSLDMVNLWTSFATTGVPDVGIDWSPVDRWSDEINYLRISKPGDLRIESDDNFGNKDFWSTIDFNENKRTSDDEVVSSSQRYRISKDLL